MTTGTVEPLPPLIHAWTTLIATARAEIRRHGAYVIDPLRAAVFPMFTYLTMWVSYHVSGQTQVEGANTAGFLVIGILGLLTWSSTIWASGYAIEWERGEGTINALFLSPASRLAVVLGYGLGSFVWFAPTLVVLAILAPLTGARFEVASPIAPILAVLLLYLGSLATGVAFSGIFVLTRRANLVANFLQLPVWLLAGFVAPRSGLPDWLRPVSDLIPASHAVDALRAGALTGASFTDVAPSLLAAAVTSAAFLALGAFALRRVEHAAKRTGTLEFH